MHNACIKPTKCEYRKDEQSQAFRRKGVTVECVQTDNGFEFTNRFSNSKRDIPTLFESTAAELGMRHNGKVERSHRED